MVTQAPERPAAPAEERAPAPEFKPRADWTNRLLGVWGVVVFIFLFAPIVVILIFSFNSGRLLSTWDGFGFDGYEAFFSNSAAQNAVKVSVIVGLCSAGVATLLGSLAGVALARRPGKWVAGFLFFVALVLVTPEIVDAVALLPWFVTLGNWGLTAFESGWVRLVVSHSLFSTAVVALIVRARMSGIDETLEEAAGDLYAPPVKRFTQITLPLMLPAVLAGALMSFTLSLDNTIISAFVQVQGVTPWPVYVLASVKSGLRPEIAAISTMMFLLTLVAIGSVALVLRRGGDSSSDIAQTMTGN
jgi:ABC-type spermidine/putrescine transport system permease subunit II